MVGGEKKEEDIELKHGVGGGRQIDRLEGFCEPPRRGACSRRRRLPSVGSIGKES